MKLPAVLEKLEIGYIRSWLGSLLVSWLVSWLVGLLVC